MKPTIFVSHAADDAGVVSQVVSAVTAGFPHAEIFYSSSPESLRPGDMWWEKTRLSLDRAAIVLVCVSRWSADRPWLMFEAGTALGRGRTLLPLIVDDLPLSDLKPPLSMFQAIRFSKETMVTVLERVASEIGIAPQTFNESIVFPIDGSSSILKEFGIYSGLSHIDIRSGWVPYTGDAHTLQVHRDYVAIGKSFEDGFRFPPVDSLTAPWRTFSFRFRFADDAYVYAVLKLTDGSTRKIIASTAVTSWGFTGSPRDEYRVPLGNQPKNRWLVASIDVQSLEPDFPAPIQALIGLRVRGRLWLSHVWCLDSENQIPEEFRADAIQFRYPR